MIRIASRRWLHGTLVCMSMMYLCSCASLFNIGSGSDSHRVRILIVKAKGSFTVSSRGSYTISRAGSATKVHTASSTCSFSPDQITSVMTIEPHGEPVLVNGQLYRGFLLIYPVKNSAWIVNVLTVDEYLMSVVPGEIPAGWEEEALKAQAVAARTYTYYHIAENRSRKMLYDLDATAASQVYRGMADEKKRTTDAVQATAGEIVTYENKPIISYFHSTCGGKTTDDRYVWNKGHLPYLRGVTCGYCVDSTKFEWESHLTLDEIKTKLSRKYPNIRIITNISFRKKDDRIVEVVIAHDGTTLHITGNTFRLMFPPEKIRSLYFVSAKTQSGLLLKGRGWGHGVGLCQWGARGMARQGYNYKRILNHYFTGVSISGIRHVYIASLLKKSHSYQ